MAAPRPDLILDPERLSAVPFDTLLEAAALGYLGVDHRFLHAIVDRREQALPELVRFALADHGADPVVLVDVLVDVISYLNAPEGLPVLISVVRQDPEEVNDDLTKVFAQFGEASVEPLLDLYAELEREQRPTGEVPFLLSMMRHRDPRILSLLTELASREPDTALYLDFYRDPAALPALREILSKLSPDHRELHRIESIIHVLEAAQTHPSELLEPVEPVDIWSNYPKEDSGPLEVLTEDDHLAMLDSSSAEVRTDVAALYRREEIPPNIKARLLQLAKSDPDPKVRGECWETLRDVADEPEMRKALLAVLTDPTVAPEERAGAAVALAHHTDNKKVVEAIEELYNDPRSRAKAMKAMAHSFDRRFADYPPRHLDDSDQAVLRQAIWGVGYLNLGGEVGRLSRFFDDDEFRSDAIFAYAIAVPGETTRGRVRSLLKKVELAAGGFQRDEDDLVRIALDQRLMMHGLEPVFSEEGEEENDEQAAPLTTSAAKPGRNDPCPCGSGKKYKKCCGA